MRIPWDEFNHKYFKHNSQHQNQRKADLMLACADLHLTAYLLKFIFNNFIISSVANKIKLLNVSFKTFKMFLFI